jgi:hypothetical protein
MKTIIREGIDLDYLPFNFIADGKNRKVSSWTYDYRKNSVKGELEE